MMIFVFLLSMSVAATSVKTDICQIEAKSKGNELEVRMGKSKQSVTISSIGPGAKINSCETKGNFWVIEAHLGISGTGSQTAEDFLFIYQVKKKGPPALIFKHKIKEKISHLSAQGKPETLELESPAFVTEIPGGKLQVDLVEEKKTVILPQKK